MSLFLSFFANSSQKQIFSKIINENLNFIVDKSRSIIYTKRKVYAVSVVNSWR